jgi:uncharacterized protein YcaQ
MPLDQLILSPTLARRLAVTKQWLARPRPEPTPAGIMEVMRDIGCLQLDPIRVVERTQYLVLWSRLGNYDPAYLDTLLWKEKQLFEYWAHAASIVLTENYPIHQAQMRRSLQGNSGWAKRVRTWLAENEPFQQYVLERLRQEGPLASDQLEDLAAVAWESDGWTNGRNVSRMIDFLWVRGQIMVADRNGLRKKWTLAERHLPEWAAHEPLHEHEVVRLATQKSLRSLGVGTAKQISNHFVRGHYPNLTKVLAELVAEGHILPVSVTGDDITWPGQWYIHTNDLPLLERLRDGDWQPRTTLLSPFDNLICDRDRTELMWDFYFRIEIYVPEAKRQYGYYVLPILHGDRLIGRVDPRMDRKTGKLHINAVYAEANAPQDEATGRAIGAAITNLAEFLGAREIVCTDRAPEGWRLR